MDFTVSPMMQELVGQVREFLKKEVYPLETDFLTKDFTSLLPILEEIRQMVKERRWWTPQIPKKNGGMGLSVLEHGLLVAELGKTPLGLYVFNCQAPDAGNMEILLKFGTDDQKERFLVPLLEGRISSCFSMTEPDRPGSNPVWMETTADKRGDEYIINGKKWFTTGGDGAAFAIVMAVTDPHASPHQRASQIIVPTDSPGFHIVCNTPIMGHRGDNWASHAEIAYENCRVPQKYLLGKEGQGFVIAQERLGPGRIHHCMRWTGICERSFDLMCEWALKRQIAPGENLGSRQFIQGWIAESRAEIDAARLMVLNAAWTIDNKGVKEAREEISLIKFFVANVMMRVIDRAIQVHGGMGVTDYTPLAYYYWSERGARIYDGPDEVHKLVVAKRILKRYASKLSSEGAR